MIASLLFPWVVEATMEIICFNRKCSIDFVHRELCPGLDVHKGIPFLAPSILAIPHVLPNTA